MRRCYSTLLTVIAALALMVSCSQKLSRVVSVETEVIRIDSTFDAVQDSAYLAELQPFKDSMERMLN